MKSHEDPEYQVMCAGAEKIQEKHKIDDGDLYYWSVDRQVHLAFTETFPEYIVKHPEQWDSLSGRKVIWLPSQEDLQEMVIQKYPNQKTFGLLERFSDWWSTGFPHRTIRIKFIHSITGLWLAFVMHELYQKEWNHKSKEWEEIK